METTRTLYLNLKSYGGNEYVNIMSFKLNPSFKFFGICNDKVVTP